MEFSFLLNKPGFVVVKQFVERNPFKLVQVKMEVVDRTQRNLIEIGNRKYCNARASWEIKLESESGSKQFWELQQSLSPQTSLECFVIIMLWQPFICP